MGKQNFSALDPYGKAILSYWQGNASAQLIQEYDSGKIIVLPVSIFFRTANAFYPDEQAVPYGRGRILVVGAGTGVHALEFERHGHQVTAIDVNPQAVQIMKERGLNDVRLCDFFEFSEHGYDTITLLGRNIGVCETRENISVLLDTCKSLLNDKGQVLVNSVKEDLDPSSFKKKAHPGEQIFRLSFEDEFGPWMRWLHIGFTSLSSQSRENGWMAEQLIETEDGGFLARLTLL